MRALRDQELRELPDRNDSGSLGREPDLNRGSIFRNRSKGRICEFSVFTHDIGKFFAVVHENNSVIIEGGFSAAELAVNLVDTDESTIDIAVGDKLCAKSAGEEDAERTDTGFLKTLGRFVIGSELRGFELSFRCGKLHGREPQ